MLNSLGLGWVTALTFLVLVQAKEHSWILRVAPGAESRAGVVQSLSTASNNHGSTIINEIQNVYRGSPQISQSNSKSKLYRAFSSDLKLEKVNVGDRTWIIVPESPGAAIQQKLRNLKFTEALTTVNQKVTLYESTQNPHFHIQRIFSQQKVRTPTIERPTLGPTRVGMHLPSTEVASFHGVFYSNPQWTPVGSSSVHQSFLTLMHSPSCICDR
jgi:hypothetical protein